MLTELVELATATPPAEMIDAVLESTGYRKWLERKGNPERRLARLATLRELASRSGCPTLAEWLASEGFADSQLEERGLGLDEVGKVVLSTIHAAKGSEADVVFVLGCEEGLLPHRQAATFSPQASERLREEQRTFYVAVTRPKKRLYLLYCREREDRDGEVHKRSLSRFVRPLVELLEPAA